MSDRREVLQRCLSSAIAKAICKMPDQGIDSLEEIRIRTGRGIYFKGYNAQCRLIPNEEDVKQCILKMSDYSIYAHMEQLKQGFITLKGGHRVGVVGRCVVSNNTIENITDISSINIRMTRQIKGVAEELKDIALNSNILIISPPGCGKTTILRDLARIISSKQNVSIIDERCEIASCVNGIPQMDIGIGSDVISNISKTIAIPLLVRSMSPDVIMTDELGIEDIGSVENACRMGVRVIATVHGENLADIEGRINTKVFNKFVVLDKTKSIAEVI